MWLHSIQGCRFRVIGQLHCNVGFPDHKLCRLVYYFISFYHILKMLTSNEPWMNGFLYLHQEENISVELQEQYKKHHGRKLECLSSWKRITFFIAHRALLDLIVHKAFLDSISLLSSTVSRNKYSESNCEKIWLMKSQNKPERKYVCHPKWQAHTASLFWESASYLPHSWWQF